MNRNMIIGLFVISIILISGCLEVSKTGQTIFGQAEPNCSEIQESISIPLASNRIDAVPNLSYRVYTVEIDVSNKQSNKISGSFTEESGHDIKLYVFDQKNFNAWKANQSYAPYVDSGKRPAYFFSFIPDHTDTYYFVFDNKYSWFTNKVPNLTATWNYKKTVTKCN